MHQQALQDVVPASQMDSPHPAGLVQMRETPLGQFAAQLLQALVARSSHAPPILIRPRLLFRLALSLPVSPASFRLWYIASDFLLVHLCQHGATVIALV